jgi:hypothetical protein
LKDRHIEMFIVHDRASRHLVDCLECAPEKDQLTHRVFFEILPVKHVLCRDEQRRSIPDGQKPCADLIGLVVIIASKCG